jgi:hypothetical protein
MPRAALALTDPDVLAPIVDLAPALAAVCGATSEPAQERTT